MISEDYKRLRNLALSFNRQNFSLPEHEASRDPLGVVMDEAVGEGNLYTLVAWFNGETSLYLSNGGGFIGLGQYEEPNQAARALVHAADGYQHFSSPMPDTPLPKSGETAFYFIGDKTYGLALKSLALRNHIGATSPLYGLAHELITAMRRYV